MEKYCGEKGSCWIIRVLPHPSLKARWAGMDAQQHVDEYKYTNEVNV